MFKRVTAARQFNDFLAIKLRKMIETFLPVRFELIIS
jgi:hypothetical protein